MLPHPAATLVLLRETDGRLEALMMRRNAGVAFMGGMWVFPGGRMDAADQSPGAIARILPVARGTRSGPLATMQGTALDPGTADGLYVAACREAFEEAGVLLACRQSGEPCDAATAARLGPRRPEVTADAAAFTRMLEAEDLFLDTRLLVYWSHWITPSVEPKRFDTRFFAAPLPAGQSVSADLSELTEHTWLEPADAGGALQRGEIRLIPPTLITLEDLAECYATHGSLPAMLAAEAGRETPPVMPRIELGADAARVVMPWDPGYGQVPGEGCEATGSFPAHLTRRRGSHTFKPGRQPAR
jgi:8-oxo-dGTP pyrophosphatase MutT (NUDIX family)